MRPVSDTYKGFPIPEILPDGKLYHIICDEGIFDGYSEDAALAHWQNKINALWWKRAVASGYIEVSDFVLGCPDCGALVWDPYNHKKFHEDLTN